MDYIFLVVSVGNITIPMRLGLGFASSNLLRVLGEQDLNHKPIQFNGTILLFLMCLTSVHCRQHYSNFQKESWNIVQIQRVNLFGTEKHIFLFPGCVRVNLEIIIYLCKHLKN